MRPLSHSSISLYLDCPQKYKFRYLDKIPEAPRHFFSFGKSVHSALEYFYGAQLLPPPSLEEVLKVYKEGWISEGYKDAAQEKAYFAEGERILKEFYSKHIPNFQLPLYCEYQFNIEVEGVPVTGFVDRIDKVHGEKLAITDYKTGKSFDLERVKRDPQLTLYQMACRKTIGMEIDSLTLYHLPSNTAFTVSPHDQALEEELRKKIKKVATGIASGEFDPDPSEQKCRWCDYRKPNPALGFAGCPAWRDEYMTLEEKQSTSYGTVDILSMVDAYGELKTKMKALEKQLEPLYEELKKYFEDKKLRKVKGKSYELYCHFKEKWNFQGKEEELEKLLKKHHLWERVLALSHSALQHLLKDSEIDKKLLEEIKNLGEAELVSTLRVVPLAGEDEF